MAGDWQWSPLGMMCRHSLYMKSFLSGDRGPHPSGCVWNKLAIFNALEAGFYRNPFVLRSLEAKFLETANLRRRA